MAISDTLLSISVSHDIPREDRESLFEELRKHVDIENHPTRALGPEWVNVIATIKDVAQIAGGASALLKIGKSIISWIALLRKRQIVPKCRLDAPDQETLNLETASEEDLRKWLSENHQAGKKGETA